MSAFSFSRRAASSAFSFSRRAASAWAFVASSWCKAVTCSAVNGVTVFQSNFTNAGVFECPFSGSPLAYTEKLTVFSANFSALVKWNSFSLPSPPRSVLSAAFPSTVIASTVPTRGPNCKFLNVK